jgi:hypothetical protein
MLLAALEEYLTLKRESQNSEDLEVLKSARTRVDSCLREYFTENFSKAMLEERRRTSSQTRNMATVSGNSVANVSWENVVKVLDFLNSCPSPLKDVKNPVSAEKWMAVYNDWHQKRMEMLRKILPPLELDLDDAFDKRWES